MEGVRSKTILALIPTRTDLHQKLFATIEIVIAAEVNSHWHTADKSAKDETRGLHFRMH